jgi:DNA-binding phage protein
MKRKTTYKAFDAATYLDNDAVIAEYLSAAAEDSNPDVFVAALGWPRREVCRRSQRSRG